MLTYVYIMTYKDTKFNEKVQIRVRIFHILRQRISVCRRYIFHIAHSQPNNYAIFSQDCSQVNQ